MPSRCQVWSGKIVDGLNPTVGMLDIEDIAYALSNINRFTGHTEPPYNVADHSLRVSRIVPAEDEYEALMHDTSEYILGDLASPLKSDPEFGQMYRGAEMRLMKVIAERYEFRWPPPESVHIADRIMLATEVRDLLSRGKTRAEKRALIELWEPWIGDVKPLDRQIIPIRPKTARLKFLERFRELGGRQ